MKHVLPFLFLLLTHIARAQDGKSQLELMPFIRYDAYPSLNEPYGISSRYGGTVFTEEVDMKGVSWGGRLSYKYLLGRNFRVKAGAGYYRYSFNDINSSSSWGQTQSRPLVYPEGILTDIMPGEKFRIYYTDRYWYNTLGLNIGLEKAFPVSPTVKIFTSVDLSHYYTFSQGYHVDDVYFTYRQDNGFTPVGFEQAGANYRELKHKPKEKQFFAYGGSLQLGLTKTVQKYAFGPSLLLPIFDTWKKDEVLGETKNEDGTRSKTFGGVGLALAISRNL